MQRSHRTAAWLALCLATLGGLPAPANASIALPCGLTDAVELARPLGRALRRGTPSSASAGPIALSPAYLPYVTVGEPYSQSVTASGGTAPYTFAVTTGTLPSGLALAPDGTLSGTVAYDSYYDYDLTITATDANGATGSRAYTMEVGVVGTIVVSPPSVSDAIVDEPYNVVFTASGGTPPYDFQCTGRLPLGLALASDGTLSGTPSEVGSFDFTIIAEDATFGIGSRDYTLVVDEATIELTPTALADGTVGAAYSQDVDASGGQPPYFHFVGGGELPPGLVLDETSGAISGTPTVVGDFGFTLTVMDATERQASRNYVISIVAPTILLGPAALPDATVGTAYEQPLSASGGTEPYSFAVSAGSLPAGMAMDGDGIVDGTPEEPGNFAFTVTATDALGQAGEHMYALTVLAPVIGITPTAVPDGTVGVEYGVQFIASGGNGPYTFAVTGGTLPPGLLLDSDGVLHGEPTSAGDHAFTVTATDNYNQTGEQAYDITVGSATITLTPTALPPGTAGTAYEQPLAASGGTGPYSFAVTGGSLPAGMSLDGDGIIDGTPEEAGTFGFTVTATDAFAQTGEQAYTLVIASPVIVLGPATLPDGAVGSGYEQTLTASGGNAPYTFAVASGTLPPGLQLGSDGVLQGTATEAGSFPFTVTATDAFAQAGDQAYTLVVDAATIVLATGALPEASVDAPYAYTFTATGGTAPYAFAIGDGTLPAGLSLGTDGTLAGTPTADGDFAFSVVATDAFEQAGSASYTLSVSAPALPDPTEDPDVVGLLTSQVSTVRTFATTQVRNVHERLEELHDGSGSGWGFWVAGSVRTGDRNGNDTVSPLDFETSGLTGGSDYRLNNNFAFGGALGYARDRTAIGGDGTRSDGDAPSGVSYMSWHPQDLPFFLDGMGGYQRLEFDVRRFSAAGAAMLEGRRHGRQEFTSWSGGYEHETDTFLFSPYARVDAAEARLDGFLELGDNPYALQYGVQEVDLRTTTLGFRMKFRKTIEWGELEPRLRIEYQRDFHDESGIAISYANQASSPVYFTTPLTLDRSRVVVELGTLLRTNWYGLLLRVDYLGVFGGYNDNEHMLRFSMQED